MIGPLTENEIQGVLVLYPNMDRASLEGLSGPALVTLGGIYYLRQRNYSEEDIQRFADESKVSIEHFAYTAFGFYGEKEGTNPNADISEIKLKATLTGGMNTTLGFLLKGLNDPQDSSGDTSSGSIGPPGL